VRRGRKARGVVSAPFGELPADLLGITVVETEGTLHTPLHACAELAGKASDSHGLLATPRGFEPLLPA
jgi:hypothetical protein